MSKKILVVEDISYLRIILRKMFEDVGYDVIEASDGIEAAIMWRDAHPDLTMMDIIMPKMDGVNAIRVIREFDHGAKIVVLSAFSHLEMIQTAVEAGAVDFLVKPFQRERILSTVSRYI